jgi:hypothetical protein
MNPVAVSEAREVSEHSPYAPPKRGLKASECSFYHRLDIPALKDRTGWMWDLVGDEAAYLGNFEFRGKRVLEFGPANGALTFWMEKQGAEVVAMDLSPKSTETSWDVLLREGDDLHTMRQRMSEGMTRLNNGFWYAHEYFHSKARARSESSTPSRYARFCCIYAIRSGLLNMHWSSLAMQSSSPISCPFISRRRSRSGLSHLSYLLQSASRRTAA